MDKEIKVQQVPGIKINLPYNTIESTDIEFNKLVLVLTEMQALSLTESLIEQLGLKIRIKGGEG